MLYTIIDPNTREYYLLWANDHIDTALLNRLYPISLWQRRQVVFTEGELHQLLGYITEDTTPTETEEVEVLRRSSDRRYARCIELNWDGKTRQLWENSLFCRNNPLYL